MKELSTPENGREELRQKILNMLLKDWKNFGSAKDLAKWRTTIDASVDFRVYHERYWDAHIHVLKNHVGNLASRLVLNVGCGVGGFEVAIEEEGAIAVGVDINSEALDAAQTRYKMLNSKWANFVLCDGFHLPFRGGSFDIVTSFSVLEHVEHKVDLIREIIHVARPEGFIYLTAGPNKRFPYDVHYRLPFITCLPERLRRIITSRLRPVFSKAYSKQHLEYIIPEEVEQPLKPYCLWTARLWPELVRYNFLVADKPIATVGPDIFLRRLVVLIKRLRMSRLTLLLARILTLLRMEMYVCVLAKKKLLTE